MNVLRRKFNMPALFEACAWEKHGARQRLGTLKCWLDTLNSSQLLPVMLLLAETAWKWGLTQLVDGAECIVHLIDLFGIVVPRTFHSNSSINVEIQLIGLSMST